MKTTKFLFIVLLGFLLGLSEPLFAQEDPLKSFAENRRERKYCLYASTLRMLNLSQNASYNDMVKDVDKLLIYVLDSATRADHSYLSILPEYEALGFEEYASMNSERATFLISGKEGRRKDQFVGIIANQEKVFAFYLKGKIGLQKIPVLIKELQELDMLNVFDLNAGF